MEIVTTQRQNLIQRGGLTAPHIPMEITEAERIAAEHYGLKASALRLATEKDDSFVLRTDTGPTAVLKVANPSEPDDDLKFQTALQRHVVEVGNDIPVPDLIAGTDGRYLIDYVDRAGQSRTIRAVEFLPGRTLDHIHTTQRERERVGEILAKLSNATATFHHPFADRVLAWDVKHILTLPPLLEHVKNPLHRSALEEGFERLRDVPEWVRHLRQQVVHNDFSKSNLLGDSNAPGFLTGVLDFGDAVYTAVAIDVSTALLNQLPSTVARGSDEDIFSHGRDVIRGYLRHAQLTHEELSIIPHFVMARIVARAVITLHRAELFPDNSHYILRNTDQGWDQLRWFLARSHDEISDILTDD